MFILDTDILSLLFRAHARVTERVAQATEEVAITLISRIEILQGRFASVLKAENSEKLLQAQQWLHESEKEKNHYVRYPDREGRGGFLECRGVALRGGGGGDESLTQHLGNSV